MILDEITLHNFGLYRGRQSISLTPVSPDKPVVLFGGLNGGGKTTLLDALQLCLFGPHAKTSSRGSLAYGEYLERCVHRGADIPEAGIQIAFRHTVEGREERYVVDRSWRVINGACKERFEVLKDGLLDPALADNWATQVDEFIPANIAHLFLFDGEQIERYASQQNSSLLIGTAIQNLLGLDMVDQLDKDLQIYERRKRLTSKDDNARAEIAAIDKELRDLRAQAASLNQERASLQTHEIDRKHRELEKTEETYRKLGGALFDQRTEIETCLSEAEASITAGENALRDLASGPLPLLLTQVLLESAESRDRLEEESRRARDVLDTLKKRDQATLKHLGGQKVGKKLLASIRQFLEQDRSEREALAKRDTLLDLNADVRDDLRNFLRGEFDAIASNATRLLRKQKKLEAAAKKIRTEHDGIPSADSIAEIANKRAGLREEIAQLQTQHNKLTTDIDWLHREIARKEQAYARILETGADVLQAQEDQERILRHSAKVRSTLEAFRRAVVARHVRRIEQLVLESYQQLLRKSSLVTRLSIDPADFSLSLYGRDGTALSPERLSAGERQLLAIALLWGLAKASGRPLPTAIDTPLGRLDTVHRAHLVERYLPFASHQILLLSTDEEIAGEYLEQLRPWIGRTYYLTYDDDAGTTRITAGYFPAREAA